MSRSAKARSASVLLATALAALLATTIAAGPASARDVVAADQTESSIVAVARGPKALASIPRGIVVTNTGGRSATLALRGQKMLRTSRPGGSRATFTGLKAGTTYTVGVGGKVIARVTAVNRPSAASRLVVETTDRVGSVALAWLHTPTAATGGRAITYAVIATSPTGPAIKATVTGQRHAELAGLDPTAIYTFTVTPGNSAGSGTSTRASMTRSLAQITGISATVAETPKPAPVPVVTPVALPTTTSAPAPAPAPAPSTRTIYVCPTGFVEVGSMCQKTAPYVIDVLAYSYHQEFVKTGSHVEYSTAPNGGTYYAAGNPNWDFGPAGYYKVIDDGYSHSVLDATPAGWTDTGTGWTKKQAAPEGYLDDGKQWVMTVAKEARVVPA